MFNIACVAADSFPFSGGTEIEQANEKRASEGARLGSLGACLFCHSFAVFLPFASVYAGCTLYRSRTLHSTILGRGLKSCTVAVKGRINVRSGCINVCLWGGKNSPRKYKLILIIVIKLQRKARQFISETVYMRHPGVTGQSASWLRAPC